MVSRNARPRLSGKQPVHATMRVLPEICSLRAIHVAVRRALLAGACKGQFRLVYFAILGNHLHLIAEAGDTEQLSKGLQGIAIRIARAVNQKMGRRRGKVFSDRYHLHVLKTPRETRAAIEYVIHNYRSHRARVGQPAAPGFIDPHSSATYLYGREANPFPAPRTWLLSTGYRKAGGSLDFER
jgi:putative transposase